MTACERCHRPLKAPASVALRYGPDCAAREGLTPPKVERAHRCATHAATPEVDARQLALSWEAAPLSAEELELDALGIAPAAWPWVLAARAEARRLGRVPVDGCPACTWFSGGCALHAPPGRPVGWWLPCRFCGAELNFRPSAKGGSHD